MRILIIHNYYQDKGGEDTVFEQESQLLAQKHEVKTIKFKNKKGVEGLLQFLLYPYNFSQISNLKEDIKAFNPDIAHVHNTHYAIGPIVFRILYNLKIPTVFTLHNYRLLDPSATLFHDGTVFTDTITKKFPWKSVKNKVLDNSLIKTFVTAFTYWLHKKLHTWQHIDTYLTFSNFMRNLILASSLDIRESQICIKPNAIRQIVNTNVTMRTKDFVFIGRLTEEKGLHIILEAFSKSNFTIKIFGTGPLENVVREFANKHRNIIYQGFQNKETIYKELAIAQALIVPSIWFEGMPMTVIESFSLGTPVIASDIGILKEMIVEKYNGSKFEANNYKSLIEKLTIWTNIDDEEKSNICKNCLDDFLEKYEADKNIELLEQIYIDTIAKK